MGSCCHSLFLRVGELKPHWRCGNGVRTLRRAFVQCTRVVRTRRFGWLWVRSWPGEAELSKLFPERIGHPPTRTTMPSADFSDAVGPPCEEPGPPMADTPETSRDKFDRLRRTRRSSTRFFKFLLFRSCSIGQTKATILTRFVWKSTLFGLVCFLLRTPTYRGCE